MKHYLASVTHRMLMLSFLVIGSSFFYLDSSSATRPVFIELGNGVIGDTRTGLIWEESGSKAPIMWEDVNNYFKYLQTGGYEDWRLPTKNELISLYEDLGIISSNQRNRCINPFIWPTNPDCSTNEDPCKVEYWSSSKLLYLFVISKDFNNGKNKHSIPGNTGKYIRAVRTTHLPDYMLSTENNNSRNYARMGAYLGGFIGLFIACSFIWKKLIVMRNYVVYGHPDHGYTAVKVGFSWPALFFGIPWMLVKKLWFYSLCWMGLLAVLFVFAMIPSSWFTLPKALDYILMCGIIYLYWLHPAFKGNQWRELILSDQGYRKITKVQAKTANSAIDLVYKSELKQNEHNRAELS